MFTTHWQRSFDQADYYFVVGNKKTYNRNIAIEWANGNIDLIKLYWMDEVWSSMDLTTPPANSWNELMRTRCQQVRSKSSIFGIAFSGGYDSQTILDHCVMNNILVDELQINHKSFNLHPEFKSAVNTANLTKQYHYPKLNISTIDIGLDYLLNIYRVGGNNWIENENLSELKFTKQNRSSLINFNSGHTKTLDLVNRVVVEGHEKPRLFIHDGWWVMAMHDGVLEHTFNTPFENFYISRELPELHLKQIWMMIDWMESQPFDTLSALEEFLHFVQKNLDNNVNEQWNLAVGRNRVRHVNSWDLGLMQKHAADGGIYSPDTAALLTRHPHLRELLQVATWENTAIEFIQKYPDTYVHTKDIAQFTSCPSIDIGTRRYPINFGLSKNIWTRRYPIKPVQPGKNNSSGRAGEKPDI